MSRGRMYRGSAVELATVTAGHIAVALVAACSTTGADPLFAFEAGRGNRRTRVMAAAGCSARLGWRSITAAKAFKVEPKLLAPSQLSTLRITTDDLVKVGDALSASGLVIEPEPEPEEPEVVTPVRVKPSAKVAPVEAAAPRPVPDAPLRLALSKPSPPRQVVKPSDTMRSDGAVRRSDLRMRPITETRWRYIRQFLDSGAWRVEDVADLFDTHPDAIAEWSHGPMGIAA